MRLSILAISLLLAACATPQAPPEPQAQGRTEAHIGALRNALPGYYSNFAQLHGDPEAGPVTEVVIRHLAADDTAAFLVSRKLRGGEVNQHQLYRFSPADDPDLLELRFAPLGEAQLSLPLPQILQAAEERFRPGCTVALATTADGLAGQTDPATCRFDHPRSGDTGLVRELHVGRGRLTIAERLLDAAGARIGEDGILVLQKHRSFEGWAGMHVDDKASPDDPAAWRLANAFTIADDGRTVPLSDAAGDSLDLGLQLSRIRWRADRPEILRLAVIRLSTGRMEAYAWSEPGADVIGINLDWFQAGLEIASD